METMNTTIQSVTISIKQGVSAEDARAVEELYQSTFATEAYANIYHPGAPKYVLSLRGENKELKHLLIFEKKGKRINVFSGMCSIEHKDLELMCKACFDKFKKVNRISFINLYNQPEISTYPNFISWFSDDYIIDLPDEIEEYRRHILAKNMKRNLNSSINRAKRDFPDFDFEIIEKEEVKKELIEKASGFNRIRMKEKGRVPGLSEKKTRQLYELTQNYGYVSRIIVEGKVAAVIINTVVGEELYFHVISHNPKYNYYRLGQVCLYLTIEHFIEKGGDKFHLLWGEFTYKYKFGGEKAILYTVEVLRYEYLKKLRIVVNKINNKIIFLKSLTLKKIIRYLKKKIKASFNSEKK